MPPPVDRAGQQYDELGTRLADQAPAAMQPELLAGGTANYGRVIRIGECVHRPSGPHTPAVHELLRHLARAGFDHVPRVVAAHARSEVLAYIEGTAATEPLAGWALSEDVLASVGALLRDYHRHAASFDGSHGRWQRLVPTRWRGPLVTHNDVNPANVIFRDGQAVALIDFDLAAPATAAWDLAVTACFWVPLRDPADIADRRRSVRLQRYRLLLDAYGADAALRRDVADAVGAANRWITDIIADAAQHGHPAFGPMWERDHGLHDRAAEWLATHPDELARTASR